MFTLRIECAVRPLNSDRVASVLDPGAGMLLNDCRPRQSEVRAPHPARRGLLLLVRKCAARVVSDLGGGERDRMVQVVAKHRAVDGHLEQATADDRISDAV